MKKLSQDLKREMKYNLLPEFFHDRFEDMEGDWTEWTDNKFLAQAQKAEAADAKERRRSSEQKEKNKKRKSQEDDDSSKNLSRSQKAKNKRSKKKRDEEEETTQGQACVCELCKLAGAPDFVFKSHFTNQCNRKDQYAKQMSGGAGKRQKTTKEYRSQERKLKRELKAVQKKLSKSKSRSRRDNSSQSEESVSDSDSDC